MEHRPVSPIQTSFKMYHTATTSSQMEGGGVSISGIAPPDLYFHTLLSCPFPINKKEGIIQSLLSKPWTIIKIFKGFKIRQIQRKTLEEKYILLV